MKRVDKVYNTVEKLTKGNENGVSALEIAKELGLERSTISRYLNELYRDNKIEKVKGRPVLYKAKISDNGDVGGTFTQKVNSLDKMIGAKDSLNLPIEKAKAAIIYPPRGLHTLLLGETGVGKSLFAEQMYEYAKEENIIKGDAPFIRFNCADYVNNPNLLTAQLFGVKKGTFTGADSDKEGLLKKAHNGILFLDEIHRLPPEGQEILFLYMDKGYFSPLGETGKMVHVNVRIIAATTEDPESFLLQTFFRRVPMVIRLPSLKERTLKERYKLIETFIKEESRRLGDDIYISKNSLISYLLYDCPNNIGQLKSDIQLSCAKAFLNYKANLNSILMITQSEIPNHVRKGLLLLQEHRYDVDDLIGMTEDILKFSETLEPTLKLTHEDESIGEDFYSTIEGKIKSYKKKGLDDGEISEILNIDIESHFQRYLGEISRHYKKDGLKNIISKEIMDLVDEILLLAKQVLNKEYDERIYLGLSFHLERSIERIKKGDRIYNPKLNFIRINYENEFIYAMKIAKIIDNKFNIEIPVDEIGYLAMFFATDIFKNEKEMESYVKIIVIMHGRSTASSMVEVVNNLIGLDFVIGLDMPLSMKPQEMYELAKEKILKMNGEKGIILMVDMGSLTNFGSMLAEETGINIRTVDMVTTSMVLDAGRKAVLGYPMEEILGKEINKKNLILVACFTGDGLARKVKKMLNNILNDSDLKIDTINIIGNSSLENRISKIKEDYNIVAIISSMEIDIVGIPFISVMDVFSGKIKDILNRLISGKSSYNGVWESLKEHLVYLKDDLIIEKVNTFITETEKKLDLNVSDDVKTGMTMHICFMIDNLMGGEKTKEFANLLEFVDEHPNEFLTVQNEIENIKRHYNVDIGENDIAHILKMFIGNSETV